MGMLKEFKEFAIKGNVIDLAVAVIIGAAFGKIVSALVEKILMPLIGSFGGVNFNEMVMNINGVDLATGAFIQAIIDFIIVAFCIFIMVKMITKAQGPEPEPEPEKTPEDVELLREIRDALKK